MSIQMKTRLLTLGLILTGITDILFNALLFIKISWLTTCTLLIFDLLKFVMPLATFKAWQGLHFGISVLSALAWFALTFISTLCGFSYLSQAFTILGSNISFVEMSLIIEISPYLFFAFLTKEMGNE